MKKLQFVLFTFVVLCAAAAYNARADSLIVMGLSKHVGTDKPHQERNWGLGYERNDWLVGAYRNSNDRTSAYALYKAWSYRLTSDITFLLPVGAATGYKLAVTPVAIPTFSYRATRRVNVDLGVMPAIAGKQSVFGLQLRVGL